MEATLEGAGCLEVDPPRVAASGHQECRSRVWSYADTVHQSWIYEPDELF